MEIANLGSERTWRLEAAVLTIKFLVFRIFLFGESARFSLGSVAREFGMPSFDSILLRIDCVLMPRGFKDDRGSNEVGDSGDELGEGSVSDESTVDIVVVGDDSADSKVEAESRRKMGDEKCELGEGRFATFTDLLGADIAKASPPLCRRTSVPSPKTDINDGKDANSDCGLVVTGILGFWKLIDDTLVVGIGGDREPCVIVALSKSALKESFGFVVLKSSAFILLVLCAMMNAMILIKTLCMHDHQRKCFRVG